MRRPAKFGNRKTVLDGITFDSAAEARRWATLKLLERGGRIENLKRQVIFPLMVNGVMIGTYRADAVYLVKQTGALVIEDTKGFRTPEYKLKAKIMAANDWPITEVPA